MRGHMKKTRMSYGLTHPGRITQYSKEEIKKGKFNENKMD